MSPLTGIVLAGGGSRRMGVDKAVLELRDEPLVRRAVRCLEPVCDEIVVASGDGQRLPGPWRQVADVEHGAGPLGGILAGLSVATSPLTAVLAVDLPYASTELLGWLAGRWDGRSWAIVPEVGGRLQPLHAIYAATGYGALRAAFEGGQRSITAVLRSHADDVAVLGTEAWAEVADPSFAININTPRDAHDAGIELPHSG